MNQYLRYLMADRCVHCSHELTAEDYMVDANGNRSFCNQCGDHLINGIGELRPKRDAVFYAVSKVVLERKIEDNETIVLIDSKGTEVIFAGVEKVRIMAAVKQDE